MKLAPILDYQSREPVNDSFLKRLIRLYKLMGSWLVRGLDSIYPASHVRRIRISLRLIDLVISLLILLIKELSKARRFERGEGG